ncbi:MAG: glycosyltransferase family 4 protein [Burkholderiaceae bacterium]|nr:glycosyltransferase family 4 protein [Burkholderiaceae bacterium]
MKHVWILNHYAYDSTEAGGTRHVQLARRLPEFGWTASIVAATTDLYGRTRPTCVGNDLRSRRCGVDFVWLRVPEYRGNGIGRMANMLAYLVRSLVPSELRGLPRPDLVIGSSVHPFAGLAAAILARRHGVPFVFEVRDLWPRTLIDMGRLRERSPTAIAMRRLERYLYRRACRVIALLPFAGDYIASTGVAAQRVVWIPNGVELDDFGEVAQLPRGRSRPVLMYLGAHGQANGLDVLIEAIARIRDDNALKLTLRMIGDGPAKASLVSLAAARGLDASWIRFEDPVPKHEVPAIAAQADAFVITVRNLPALYRYGISMNKLYDYMAAGRPVVIASGAANNPIEEARCGVTAAADDPVALARAITELLSMGTEMRREMGLRARAYVEAKHAYRQLAARLAQEMDACLSERT